MATVEGSQQTATHHFEIALSIDDTKIFAGRPRATEFVGTEDTSPDDLLTQHPVEVFLADHSRHNPPTDSDPLPPWYRWLLTDPGVAGLSDLTDSGSHG